MEEDSAAAVGLLAGPVPPLAEPVAEPVDGLDQRRPLVREVLACLPPVGAWSRSIPVVATRTASRNTTAYSNRARASGPVPVVRRTVSRMRTAAARAMVHRPRSDRPGAGSSWPRTKPVTTRKPLTARVGHSQRPTDRAVWRGRGPGSTSGVHPVWWGGPQPGGWLQPLRACMCCSFTRGMDWVGGGRRVRPAGGSGVAPPHRGPGGPRGQAGRRWRRPRGRTGSQEWLRAA